LILTHGWRWTFWHWSMVIDPLTDPAVFGGDLTRSMNVGQQTPQQIRADVGEAIDQDLVQVDSVDIGHRVVLPRVTLVGLTRSYAMLPSLGYDTMVRSDSRFLHHLHGATSVAKWDTSHLIRTSTLLRCALHVHSRSRFMSYPPA
jgi:hypothetical protein